MSAKRLIVRCAVAAMLTACAASGHAASPQNARGWEPVKTERSDAKPIVKESEVEIKTISGTIIVTATRPVEIKVFSIIGRQVSEETLPAGTHQLQVPTHGIYIVKVGELTCKVAI